MVTKKDKTRVRAPQQRQIERVNILLDCAAEILKTKSIEELSLAEISEKTGVALPSIYYYYPNKNELLVALANKINSYWINDIHDYTDRVDWQTLICIATNEGARYLNESPFAMKVLLSFSSPFDARIADQNSSRELAHEIAELFARLYQNFDVDFMKPRMEIYISILDGIWQAAYNQYGHIPDHVVEEAKLAVVAYLRCYLPHILPYKSPHLVPDI